MINIFHLLVEICTDLWQILLTISSVAGIIALLFQLGKIKSFILSFFYMRKAGFKALLLRFNLNVEEMRLINEFIDNKSSLSFRRFINPPQLGKRIVAMKDMPGLDNSTKISSLKEELVILNKKILETTSLIDRETLKLKSIEKEKEINAIEEQHKILFRLPNIYERNALISLMNKGLIIRNSQTGLFGLNGDLSSNEIINWRNDLEISDCIITDKFIELFR
jgi:hypothetical protein